MTVLLLTTILVSLSLVVLSRCMRNISTLYIPTYNWNDDMKNIMKSVLIGVTIATSLAMTAIPAFAETDPSAPITSSTINLAPIPDGSVIFGNGTSYTLSYANNIVNTTAVLAAVAAINVKIWAKDFSGNYIDNNTGLVVSSTVILQLLPPITYT